MEKETRTCLAFIIWNVKFDYLPQRTGANNDITGMQDLLEGLGYRVDVEKNLTALVSTETNNFPLPKGQSAESRPQQSPGQGTGAESQRIAMLSWMQAGISRFAATQPKLKQFASRLEHQTSDSTFLVLMSHGVTNGICGKDYTDIDRQILPIERIFQIFNTRNCPSLKDKAKIIILQACRGALQTYLQDPYILESDAFYKAHVEKDFIAFCSSTPSKPLPKQDFSNENLPVYSLYLSSVKWSKKLYWDLVEDHMVTVAYLFAPFLENLIGIFHIAAKTILRYRSERVQHSFEMPMEKIQMPTIERATLTKYFYLFPGN
ncbi:caspase-4-like [Sarcophilus harrisii]